MIYFDTNVVIYALEIVRDDEHLMKTAKKIFDQSINAQQAILSFLTIAEVSFVLAKLKVEQEILAQTLHFLAGFARDILVDSALVTNFLTIAGKTRQYRHSFDILHVEIARRLNCHKIITFDRELKKIQSEYHDITIEILK